MYNSCSYLLEAEPQPLSVVSGFMTALAAAESTATTRSLSPFSSKFQTLIYVPVVSAFVEYSF